MGSDVQTALMSGAVLDDGGVVLVGHDGAVLVSRDNGRRFVPHRHPAGSALAAVLSGTNGELLLFGEAGVQRLALRQAGR